MKSLMWKGGILLSVIMATMAFQNCAPPVIVYQEASQAEAQNAAAFFKYPYTSTPAFYGDIQIFQQAGSTTRLESMTFVGAASYLADENAAITYEISLKDPDAAAGSETICPRVEGTLNPGQSAIEFDCVTSRSFKTVKILMSLKAGSASAQIEKVYQK